MTRRASLILFVVTLSNCVVTAGTSNSVQFYCGELLTRPTSSSITIHACANVPVEVYYEYGTDSLNYADQTTVQSVPDSIPIVTVLENLQPNTQYYYRMRYREIGTTGFLARSSHFFRTQRPSGSAFTFAIEADPHLDTNSNPAVYALTLQNILAKKPDFLLDLGDTFMSEKLPVISQADITARHLLLRSYFDIACHSVPLFLALGNHEGELGWRADSLPSGLPVIATNTRKLYYPNPVPNSFYSGNSIPENYVGLRENYYAWEWGNALFIVLDPYWYTKRKPGWGWTLGAAQFNWFRTVITTSTAKFKFVFCHQLVGGDGNDGRGGTEFAHLWEMGGRNADSTWEFDANRPGWGGKPVHQLMVENGGAIFFHGHDHFFGKQEKDGIVYQEVPQPSLRSFTNLPASTYGYINGVFIPNRGYLLVTVTDTSAKVEYIRTYLPSEENATRHNGDVSHSYSIVRSGSTSVVQNEITPTGDFRLEQNYPNPFNPSTTIGFEMSKFGFVSLKVFDMLGGEVARLVNERLEPGSYSIAFEPTSLSAGVYYCRLSVGDQTKTMKMMYLK